MSLPPLLKHIYNHGTEEVIRRGKKIFHTSGVQMMDVDHLQEQVRFRVRNDLYNNFYTVTVNRYLDENNLSVRCQCPYNLGEVCRHEVAALFQLNDIIQSGFFENTDIEYDQKHTMVRMRQVNMQMLRVFASAGIMEEAERMADRKQVILLGKKQDRVEAEVPDGDDTYKVIIKQNDERYFDTSCKCDEKDHPLCLHKAAAFVHIIKTFGAQYFNTLRNWDDQKNKLLGLYGYSLDDDITGKFEFTYENGKPFLRVLDPTLKKVNRPVSQPSAAPSYSTSSATKKVSTETGTTEVLEEKARLGIVIDTSVDWYPFVNISLVSGDTDEDNTKFLNGVERLNLQQFIDPRKYADEDRELLPIIRKFTPQEILKYLKKNLPFGDFYDDYKEVLKEVPEDDVKHQTWDYLLPKYQKMLNRYSAHTLCFLQDSSKLSSKSLEPVEFAMHPVHPQLSVEATGDGYSVVLSWNIDDNYVPFGEVKQLNEGLLAHDFKLYAVANMEELSLVQHFMPDGKLNISKKEWSQFLEEKLLKWTQVVHVTFGEEIVERVEQAQPVYRLYLREREQTLMMRPVFVYEGVEVEWGFFGDVIQPQDGVVRIIKRKEGVEQEFIQMLRNLHTDIQQNLKEHFFYMGANAVLAHNWFFRFVEEMKEWNVELFGFEKLNSLRINTHKPETKVQVSSGIDWFDASVELVFGDQSVSITDVKRALAQKQNFVKLNDGSLGLLPEEWLKKYALLIKMGEKNGNKLRLKKYHFGVLDELLAEVDEEAMQLELEDKKQQLAKIIDNKDFSGMEPPEGLDANLRPYQLAGFQWITFLKEAGWGGILADDMGLGKTVQTLAFFQHYKKDHPNAKYLVVCPTTLMYNWENEIKKFTPELTHFIHHGPKRKSSISKFEDHDIVITTYGTMRSDIKILKEMEFDYVVLDESQSIKNPQSQVAKASLLLNAKYRLALSGTPVQNNTFDLFAQMNFLNPGMLGSREFFMNEFATPIDKFQEPEVIEQLKKLTYPFLLRRTKEQVAKDLPEKTETILYCEMGKEQRKIYDAYRNSYKSQILGMIEERGLDRSKMHILQGLTKLRQICDSPAILNESERFENHSVKLDELSREINENTGDHKVLIFSQFLGMLGLIREELEKKGIPYVYFDGSTSSTDREKAIQKFQKEDKCRVFLISLKAGGIGLNLTAADYVYIVDPWWNPAVEQQAIDRTHRIGQTKNIFAYRLICKDTIEEKMLILQERKRALASDLVSEDNAFLKKLTQDDIAFLFS